jgi:hypothetical protein
LRITNDWLQLILLVYYPRDAPPYLETLLMGFNPLRPCRCHDLRPARRSCRDDVRAGGDGAAEDDAEQGKNGGQSFPGDVDEEGGDDTDHDAQDERKPPRHRRKPPSDAITLTLRDHLQIMLPTHKPLSRTCAAS